MRKIKIAKMDPEKVAKQIGNFVIKEILEEGRNGAILGLSGGVDSTATAAIVKRAFDEYNLINENKLELVGLLLPSKTNSPKDEEDGKKVAERLGIRYEKISIQPIVDAYSSIDDKTMKEKFHKGNLMSEIRALILHRKSAIENKILVGTGNHDEDLGVGYYTLFGDGAVRCSPIGMLPKRLVRDMARYLGFADLADRVSTPGLEEGQTAFKDLGYKYEIIVELVSYGLEQGFSEEEILQNECVLMEANLNILEYRKVFGINKFQNAQELIRDILKRNKMAKGKARILSPPIAQIDLEMVDAEEVFPRLKLLEVASGG
jgi:NAD+ synthase